MMNKNDIASIDMEAYRAKFDQHSAYLRDWCRVQNSDAMTHIAAVIRQKAHDTEPLTSAIGNLASNALMQLVIALHDEGMTNDSLELLGEPEP